MGRNIGCRPFSPIPLKYATGFVHGVLKFRIIIKYKIEHQLRKGHLQLKLIFQLSIIK